MAQNLQQMGIALGNAMKNPLAKITKKSEVANAITSDEKQLAPNQISPQLDKFENSLIHKRKYKES